MTPGASKIVQGYVAGLPVELHVVELECGHFLRADLVHQVQEALAAGRADGMFISISSSWRSYEEQEKLYTGFKEGRPSFNPADPPGFSKHQDGTAIDLAFGSGDEREHFAAIADAHGMTRPHFHEPWHFVVAKETPPTEDV